MTLLEQSIETELAYRKRIGCCDRRNALLSDLLVEYRRVMAENFGLAAGQCAESSADEGGTPYCKRIKVLEAQLLDALQAGVRSSDHAVEETRRAYRAEARVRELEAAAAKPDNLRDAGPAAFGGRNAGLKRD